MAGTVSKSTLLDQLSQIGGEVGIAIQLGEVLVPIGKAVIQKIKGLGASEETLTYQLLVEQDQAELTDVDKLSTDDLAAINAELIRQGKQAVTPPAPPST